MVEEDAVCHLWTKHSVEFHSFRRHTTFQYHQLLCHCVLVEMKEWDRNWPCRLCCAVHHEVILLPTLSTKPRVGSHEYGEKLVTSW